MSNFENIWQGRLPSGCAATLLLFYRRHRYEHEQRIRPIELFSIEHASDFIVIIDSGQGSRRKVDAYCFRSAISAGGFRKRFKALSRGALQPAAAEPDEIHMGRHLFHIFEIRKLTFWNYSKVSEKYMSETSAFVQRPVCSGNEGHGNNDRLSRACYASLLICLAMRVLWDGCCLLCCVVSERTGFLANIISGKIRGLSQCRFRSASIVVMHLTRDVCMPITCLAADIRFSSEYCSKWDQHLKIGLCLICTIAGSQTSAFTDMKRCEQDRHGVMHPDHF